MRRLSRRTGLAVGVAAVLLGSAGLPVLAQGTAPPPQAPDGATGGAGAQPPGVSPTGAAQVVAQQPAAAQPDIIFTTTLHIDELRFNEPPQASLQVVVQPSGQPLVDLQLENMPNAPQAGTTYRDVRVRLTVSGALADVALGSGGAGPAPGVPGGDAGSAAGAPGTGAEPAPSAPAP